MADNTVPAVHDHQAHPLACDDIREPGAYVEVTTGALHRVSEETLSTGALSRIGKDSAPGARFVRVSKDPHIFELGARLVCARYRIRPNF